MEAKIAGSISSVHLVKRKKKKKKAHRKHLERGGEEGA